MRRFPFRVKQLELISSNYRCRMCGRNDSLQIAHIYSLSLKLRRRGTLDDVWKDDRYVRSYRNALTLCKWHHSQIDSVIGLQRWSVEILQKFK